MRGTTALRRSLEELAEVPIACRCPRHWRGPRGETHRRRCPRMVWLRVMRDLELMVGMASRDPVRKHARRVMPGTDKYGQWQWDGEAKKWRVVFDEEGACAA